MTKIDREKKAEHAAQRKNWLLTKNVDVLGRYMLQDVNRITISATCPDAQNALHSPFLTLDQVESILQIG